MAKNDSVTSYFLDAAKGAQISGVLQNTSTPKLTEGNTGLQLGSGVNIPMLDVATPCVFTPAVIVVTSTPAMYTTNGTASVMAKLIKELCESHAKSVSGIDFSYTLGTQGSPVGHDSQEMLVPTKTTRSGVSPSFTFPELSGNLVFNTFKKWIFDIQHPDTNASMAQVVYPGAYTMSAYAMTMMVIQFDPTMRPDHIIDAAFYCNMFPLSTGDIGFERTIGQVKHPERTIGFSAYVQHNDYIKTLAMAIADKLALHKHNYNLAPAGRDSISNELVNEGLARENKEYMAWAGQKGVQTNATTPGSSAISAAAVDGSTVAGGFTNTNNNWADRA